MLRAGILAVVLAGCDQLFGLVDVPDFVPPDAAPDAAPDAPPNPGGCADQTREGFREISAYPDVAGCAGAWSLPGLRAVSAACNHQAGNDGVVLTGVGCSAADLCAAGWHVCQTRLDVASHQPVGMRSCAGVNADADMFFATAQSGPGGDCSDNATDDFVGCGSYGIAAMANCSPLDMTTNNMCIAFGGVGGWVCPEFNNEVNTVTKTEPLVGGGVLCCRD